MSDDFTFSASTDSSWEVKLVNANGGVAEYAVIPEFSTWGMMAVGFVGLRALGFFLRRKKAARPA